MEEFIVGVLGKSHGVKGFINLKSLSGETEHFFRMKNVILQDKKERKEFVIDQLRKKGDGRLLIKFVGVETPEEVRKYSQWELVVSQEYAAPLKKGEHYISDLIGCQLIHEGTVFGVVRNIVDTPNSLMLDCESNAGASYLVPYLKRYFGKADIKIKKIELLAPWILE